MTKNKKIIVLILKHLENKCTQEELDDLIQLIHKGDYKDQIEILLYEYWKSKPSFQEKLDKKELDEMLDSIHRKIRLESNYENQSMVKQLGYYLGRAAAILFIPLLIGTIWLVSQNGIYNLNEEMITLETPLGSKLKTTLPDGTEVWQNAGTTLKYPMHFTKKNRKVELIGEAYFHVSSDKKNPFYVETTDGTVKVTGTRFNVSAFPDDEFSSVVLEEGEVAFQSENSKPLIHLSPEEQITINKESGTIRKQRTDVEKYTSWIDGKLIFRNDPLDIVVKRLERWYNAEIILTDPDGSLAKHPLTLTVHNETLSQVLEYITEAANLNLEVQGSGISANATFVKSKYIISRKYR